MSDNGNYMNERYARKKMRVYFQFSLIAVAFVVILAVVMIFTKGKNDAIDYSGSDFVQFEEPSDSAPVVVFETTEGVFRAVRFEEEAPEYCGYFEKLVNDGYFNDTYVCTILRSENGQTGGFIGGSKTKDGKATADTDTDMVNLEISANMLPVKGTLGSLVKQGGTFSKSKAGSVFTVLGDVVDVEELRNAGGEDVNGFKRVSEIFEKYGGIPNYLQMYTFFGQIYDGWETVDKILGTSIVDEGVPDDEDKNLQPVTEIKFTQVYMSTYGEQKENGYTIPEKGEKSGSESDKE